MSGNSDNYVSWRDCFFSRAELWYEELVERASEKYNPYHYVEEQEQYVKFNDCILTDFDWSE